MLLTSPIPFIYTQPYEDPYRVIFFFSPRTSSTASTRVLTLYHRESDPEEEDEEEEELPPKSDTFVNEAYDGKEVSRPCSGPSL